MYNPSLRGNLLVLNFHKDIRKMTFENLSLEMHTYFKYKFCFCCLKNPLKGYRDFALSPVWGLCN